jgi:16S rRNA (uracil1498-N3)-methyltransferase
LAPTSLVSPRPGELIALDESQSRHGINVLRLKAEQILQLVGPWGLVGAVVEKTQTNPKAVLWARLFGPVQMPQDLEAGAHLGLALIKGPRFDWAVEKATELGARRLVPLATVRTSAAEVGTAKKARWTRLSQEARKQCARPFQMIVSEPTSLTQWVQSDLPFPRFMLDPFGTPFPLEPIYQATLLVGPEGGLTEEEKALAESRHFQSVSLGDAPLRSETAAMSALALVGRLAPKTFSPKREIP